MVNSFNLPGKEICRWNLKEFGDDDLNKTVLLITVLYLGTYECEFTIRITHKKTRQQTTTNKGNPMTLAILGNVC